MKIILAFHIPGELLRDPQAFPGHSLRNNDLAQATVLRIRDVQTHDRVDTFNLKFSERQTCTQIQAMQVSADRVHGPMLLVSGNSISLR